MKVNILAIGAHPDDVELSAAGTILAHRAKGHTVAIVDLTKGELGTRGDAETREKEAAASAKILGVSFRETLTLADGLFELNTENTLEVVRVIRKYQPEILLCNAVSDRHPDHARGGDLVARAAFLAGLRKIDTFDKGVMQGAWRPKVVYRYIQDRFVKPDVIVDVTPFWEKKMEAIMAFGSQFYNPDSKEPQTAISSMEFLEFLKGRAMEYGRTINVKYGEGFNVERTPGVQLLSDLL